MVGEEYFKRILALKLYTGDIIMETPLKDDEFWLSAVLENIPEGVIGVNDTGTVAWMNSAAERLTGLREQQVKDKPIEAIFSLSAKDAKRSIGISVQYVLNSGNKIQEKNQELILPGNRSVSVDYVIAPVFSGGDCKSTVMIFAVYASGVNADKDAKEKRKKFTSSRNRSWRVLVMDDDAVIRKLTTQKLVRLGYESEGVESGEDAVARFRAALDSGCPFDIVVLDLVVHGGMDGKDTLEALKGIDPDVKAILATGYTTDPVLTSFWEFGFMGVVRKPFVIKELDVAIQQALNNN